MHNNKAIWNFTAVGFSPRPAVGFINSAINFDDAIAAIICVAAPHPTFGWIANISANRKFGCGGPTAG